MNILPNSFRRILALSISTVLASLSCQMQPRREALQKPLLTVIEMVYHDGWKSCGSILVETNGDFVYRTIDVWSPRQSTEVHRGVLPSGLLAELDQVAHSSGIQSVAGTPTYEYYVDEHHHLSSRPEAIKSLMRLVRSGHN